MGHFAANKFCQVLPNLKFVSSVQNNVSILNILFAEFFKVAEQAGKTSKQTHLQTSSGNFLCFISSSKLNSVSYRCLICYYLEPRNITNFEFLKNLSSVLFKRIFFIPKYKDPIKKYVTPFDLFYAPPHESFGYTGMTPTPAVT